MNEFMKSYTISEVSKIINVPPGTIYQWEKDFEGVLYIQRNEKSERIFTDFEIETLKHIKAMREENLSKKVIKKLLERQRDTEGEERVSMIQPTIPQMQQTEAIETLRNIQRLPEEIKTMLVSIMDEMKEELKKEIREEIRSEVKNEVITEVRREISSGSESRKNFMELERDSTSEKIETVSENIEKLESKHEAEIQKRDEALIENTRLIKELREEKDKNKGFLKKLFG